jgi:hypothetical protein
LLVVAEEVLEMVVEVVLVVFAVRLEQQVVAAH